MVATPERAGAAYFALVFMAGFAMGTVRVLLVEPRFGPATSVLLELPVMLAISFVVAGWLVRRVGVGQAAGERLRMGLLGVALLIVAELALGAYGFGMPVGEQLAAYASPRGLLTLAGQAGFALMPLLVARTAA